MFGAQHMMHSFQWIDDWPVTAGLNSHHDEVYFYLQTLPKASVSTTAELNVEVESVNEKKNIPYHILPAFFLE